MLIRRYCSVEKVKMNLGQAISMSAEKMFAAVEDKEVIKRRVAWVLDTFADAGALDPAKMIRVMGASLYTYTQLEEVCGKEAADKLKRAMPYGFSRYEGKLGKPVVYYNDKIQHHEVVRTLFHEMGHVVMKHVLLSETGEKEERQADYFTMCFLMAIEVGKIFKHKCAVKLVDLLATFVLVQIVVTVKDKTGRFVISPAGVELLLAAMGAAKGAERDIGCAKGSEAVTQPQPQPPQEGKSDERAHIQRRCAARRVEQWAR